MMADNRDAVGRPCPSESLGLSVAKASTAFRSPSCSSEPEPMATSALPRSSILSPRRCHPRCRGNSVCPDSIVRGPEWQGKQRAEQFLTGPLVGGPSPAEGEDQCHPLVDSSRACFAATQRTAGARATVWSPVAERASGPPRSPETHTAGSQPLPFRCPLPSRPEGELDISFAGLSAGPPRRFAMQKGHGRMEFLLRFGSSGWLDCNPRPA